MECTDHVVVGVDGSPASIAAAVWAQDIARAGDWPLTILHTPPPRHRHPHPAC
ncbi:universal stress protein [Propioniciclava flava]